MTNYEKYKDEIISRIVDDFAITKNGEISFCSDLKCDDCVFWKVGETCIPKIKKWLNEECDEIDNVNHPKHYQSKTGLEAIDVIEAFTSGEDFCIGNAIKYICRWKNKNGKEDIKKAIWYLERLLNE